MGNFLLTPSAVKTEALKTRRIKIECCFFCLAPLQIFFTVPVTLHSLLQKALSSPELARGAFIFTLPQNQNHPEYVKTWHEAQVRNMDVIVTSHHRIIIYLYLLKLTFDCTRLSTNAKDIFDCDNFLVIIRRLMGLSRLSYGRSIMIVN